MDNTRYTRQIALPEISAAQQQKLAGSRMCIIGVGGLGTPALPYLAGAGIGHITIIDHDDVSITNLHRQTIFTEAQEGRNKAALAADYITALNSEIEVIAITEKLTTENAIELCSNFDLLFDGSDNFETKSLLNEISIKTKTPLLSASVNRFEAQAGLFAGFAENKPCYRCLFPQLPLEARNCNEAGILGTAAGLAGLYQAHIALCFLLGLDNITAGHIFTFDFKSFRVQQLHLQKDTSCLHCGNKKEEWKEHTMNENPIEIVHPDELRQNANCIIIDVRTDAEVANDPLEGALHIELQTIPSRFKELPQDKRLAFACASNMRSMQAAEFMRSMGYENVCVYDRLAG